MTIVVQVLTTPGCANGARTLESLRELLPSAASGAVLESVLVASAEDAVRLGFPGSPTVRIDGLDVDPDPPAGVGLG